jgi:hypothetical protein
MTLVHTYLPARETKTGGSTSNYVTEARRKMPIADRQVPTPITAQFEFEALKALPCGCVASLHRTLDPGLSVVSLEAKGTYCGLMDHVMGRTTAVPARLTDEFDQDLESDY